MAKAIRATSAPVIHEADEIYISRRSDNEDESVTESVSVMAINKTANTKDLRKKEAPYFDKTVQEKAELKS